MDQALRRKMQKDRYGLYPPATEEMPIKYLDTKVIVQF